MVLNHEKHCKGEAQDAVCVSGRVRGGENWNNEKGVDLNLRG